MDYHKERFEDFSLLIFKNTKLVAVLPANKKDNEVFSHQGLTYGGLVFENNLKLNDVILIYKVLLKYLYDNGIKKLYVKTVPLIYTVSPNAEQDYIFYLLKASFKKREALSVINLKLPIKLSKDRKAGVKRSEKHKVKVKEVQEFTEFWNSILIPNLKEKHNVLPVHSLDEITLLKERFPNNIRQFNAYVDDEIVAGTTIFETKYVAHSQYISGNSTKNQTGSLDALHYHLLTDVFKDKMYFDFGISNENQGRNLNEGLLYWKESFGARTITADFYSLDTENYTLLDDVML